MDRLQANEALSINQELVSNNGWFRLRMSSSGALVLYRTQVGHTVWTSTAVAQVGALAAMQADGNFVTRAAQGAPYWSTGTAGHPGAWVVLQDDGNLVVYDSANHALWASQSTQDLMAPTIRYSSAGYSYNETSESWKQMCTAFPCFWALQWPGYATDVIEDKIDGQDVVIQLWKGLCPKFLGFAGLQAFPGGVGAEVGIYRRIPGKLRTPSASLGFLPQDLSTRISGALTNLTDNELWWPFPELGATLEFTFINPVTGETVFSAGAEQSYWLTKWMDEGNFLQYEGTYRQYQTDHATPANWTDYILEYKINGKSYPQWPAGAGAISAEAGVISAGALLLLLS
jgi:hypothetical protein